MKLTDKEALIAEAACCVWEEMLERRDTSLRQSFQDAGTGQMRLCAVHLAPYAEKAWHEAGKPDDISYDWEFIPWFLDECVDLTGQGALIYADPEQMLVSEWDSRCRRKWRFRR